MGKKILTAMIVAVVAVVAGYNIYVSQKDITLSELALANIEALAEYNEVDKDGYICYTTYTSADWFHSDQTFIDCDNCYQKKGRNLQDRSHCRKQKLISLALGL